MRFLTISRRSEFPRPLRWRRRLPKSLLAATGMLAMGLAPAVAVAADVADLVEGADAAQAPGPLLQIDLGSAIWNLLIFLAVLAILAKFVWPPILHGLQAREDRIRSDLEGAEKANAEARRLLADYDLRLKEASAQVQALLNDARRDGEKLKDRIVAEAKAEAERQRNRALADIQQAKSVAISELASHTSEMAIRLARQVVGRELNAEDHAELIHQSLQQLPSRN
jgi:F-type H+-transporting ATPase subunit b